MAMTDKERQKLRRERLRAKGKKQVLVTLEPAAHELLVNECQKTGLTISQVVDGLLTGSQKSAGQEEIQEVITEEGETLYVKTSFKKAYERFKKEFEAAKAEGWTSTSFNYAASSLGELNNII